MDDIPIFKHSTHIGPNWCGIPAVSHITCWSCSIAVACVAVAQLVPPPPNHHKVHVVERRAIQKLNFFRICVANAYDLEGSVFCTGIMTVIGRAWNKMIAISDFWTCIHMNTYISSSSILLSAALPSYHIISTECGFFVSIFFYMYRCAVLRVWQKCLYPSLEPVLENSMIIFNTAQNMKLLSHLQMICLGFTHGATLWLIRI
jgi:hypothetical protein